MYKTLIISFLVIVKSENTEGVIYFLSPISRNRSFKYSPAVIDG